VRETADGRRERPDQEAGDQDTACRKAIAEPADERLSRNIRDEERRQ